MSKVKRLKVLKIILIVLLVGGCFYFYNLYKETEVKLKNTTTELNNTTTGVEINIGKPDWNGGASLNIVTSLDDRNTIIFALINAETVDKPEIASKLPDAQISIYKGGMRNGGMIFYNINIWQDGDNVIFDLGDGHEKRYKELSINSKDIIDVITKYIPKHIPMY